MYGLILAAAALAAEPPALHPADIGDGLWRTELVIPAPIERVQASLADPIRAAAFSPDIASIEFLDRGTCEKLRAVTSGSVSVAYDYQRCPTADGWHETMTSSRMLAAYEVRWRLRPVSGGTHVTYDLRITPKFPAPSFIFSGHMRDSITTLLGRMYRKVTAS
jgi:hypothetical protein